VSGTPEFRARLLCATTILSWLVKRRSEEEIARIKREAIELFGDEEGRLDLEALANAPRTARAGRSPSPSANSKPDRQPDSSP